MQSPLCRVFAASEAHVLPLGGPTYAKLARPTPPICRPRRRLTAASSRG
jgi:hypothetical protein